MLDHEKMMVEMISKKEKFLRVIRLRKQFYDKITTLAESFAATHKGTAVGQTVGGVTGVVGGGLQIAGGILTLCTAGLASPILIAGSVVAGVGGATSLTSSITKGKILSKIRTSIKDLMSSLEDDEKIFFDLIEQIKNKQTNILMFCDQDNGEDIFNEVAKELDERSILDNEVAKEIKQMDPVYNLKPELITKSVCMTMIVLSRLASIVLISEPVMNLFTNAATLASITGTVAAQGQAFIQAPAQAVIQTGAQAGKYLMLMH